MQSNLPFWWPKKRGAKRGGATDGRRAKEAEMKGRRQELGAGENDTPQEGASNSVIQLRGTGARPRSRVSRVRCGITAFSQTLVTPNCICP